jgi:serine/threonine protein kinase
MTLYASKGEDFDPSSSFGEYNILTELGEGGFGKVLLAEHRITKDKFAIKTIKTEAIGSAADIDSIFVEAEILKGLRHDNIVKVYNCLTLQNMQMAIIMEYLEGGELLAYV